MTTTPLQIDIDTSEVDSFVVKFPISGPKIAEKGLSSALDESLAFATGQVVDLAPVNTGIFRGSIFNENRGVEVDLFRGIDMEGIVSSSDFEPKVNAIEFGRAAGKMPPIEAILLWVKQRKLAGVFSVKTGKRLGSKATKERQDLAAAWGIAKHIAATGTEAQRVFERAFEASIEPIGKIFDDNIDLILNAWAKIE